MKKFLAIFPFFLIPMNLFSEISLRVNWPPPSDCGNGCDHTIGYPTGNCYQCPTGEAETIKCQGRPDSTASGHLCEKQLYWYGTDWQCMCWDACDGCKSNVYSNFMGLSISVVPSSGGFALYAMVPYQVPCHWCLSNPWGNCNSAGMCVIQNLDSSKN